MAVVEVLGALSQQLAEWSTPVLEAAVVVGVARGGFGCETAPHLQAW